MTGNIEKKAEDKKKKSIRFNIIDIIIIVAVVACIIGVALRIILTQKFQDENMKEYIVAFSADNLSYAQKLGIEHALDEAPTGGNFVSFADMNESFGKLNGITDSKLLYVESYNGDKIYFETGENYDSSIENYELWKDDSVWSIKGTMICKGEYIKDKGFMLNGDTYLAANSEVNVTTKYSGFVLKILYIELYK